MDAPHLTSLVGQYVGKYRIAAAMGRRGLGDVYEVVQDSIGHRAIMKVLPGQLAADPKHEKYVSRFLDEARAVNYLDSPGAVRIFDFGERPDRSVYVLLEYLEGELLEERLERLRPTGGRMEPAMALRLTRQIADVLALAHGKGIMHRDIKPENILVVQDREAPGRERVKILDFGLAKFLDTPERRTTAGMTLGSPTYMSPEQCLGADQIDGQTDVYSLGVLCYQMLTGRPPFEGEMRVMLVAHLNQAPPPLEQLAPGVPAPVRELVNAMLAKKPQERPAMAQVEATIAGMEARGILGAAAAGAPSPGPGRRRMLATLGAAGAGMALVGLLAGWALFARAAVPPPRCPDPPAAAADPEPKDPKEATPRPAAEKPAPPAAAEAAPQKPASAKPAAAKPAPKKPRPKSGRR